MVKVSCKALKVFDEYAGKVAMAQSLFETLVYETRTKEFYSICPQAMTMTGRKPHVARTMQEVRTCR